jgi:hypothetical protein
MSCVRYQTPSKPGQDWSSAASGVLHGEPGGALQSPGLHAGLGARARHDVLRERVRAGLANARQSGKRLGRPITAALHADQVRKLRGSGLSKSEIARRLNIGRTSVRRILDRRAKA